MSTANSHNPVPSPSTDPGAGAPHGADGGTPLVGAPLVRPAAEDPASLKEDVLWVGRTHWKHFIGSLSAWVLGSVVWCLLVGGVVKPTVSWSGWIYAGPIIAAGAIVFGRMLWVMLSTRYRLTNQRIFIDRGILSQAIDQTELIRVDDVRVFKSFVDRVMGLGTVELLTTDSTEKKVIIEGIGEPDRVAETVRTHMKRLRKKAMFVESL